MVHEAGVDDRTHVAVEVHAFGATRAREAHDLLHAERRVLFLLLHRDRDGRAGDAVARRVQCEVSRRNIRLVEGRVLRDAADVDVRIRVTDARDGEHPGDGNRCEEDAKPHPAPLFPCFWPQN